MPKVSKRQRLLEEVEQCLKFLAMTFLLEMDSDTYSEEGDSSDITQVELVDKGLECYHALAAVYCKICSRRFLTVRSVLPKSRDFVMNYFLGQPENEFRQITRVTKATFHFILSQIAEHPIFHNASNCPQLPVHWQLACALDRMGNDGHGVSLGRSKYIWGLGHGIVHLYTKRVIIALLAMESQWLVWPDVSKRCAISNRMAAKGFRNCVGFVDGTVFPLHKKPVDHGNVYMNRKHVYSVNAQVVCDDQRCIIHFVVGDPRNSHDASVFADSPLVREPNLCFSPNEYLLADSAYAASHHLVPSYKDNQRDNVSDVLEPRKIEVFNLYLAKARVVNEHTIGVLKSIWHSLAGLRIDIRQHSDVTKVCDLSRACVILHNMCIGCDPWSKEEARDEVPVDSAQADIPDPIRGTIGQRKRRRVRSEFKAWFGTH